MNFSRALVLVVLLVLAISVASKKAIPSCGVVSDNNGFPEGSDSRFVSIRFGGFEPIKSTALKYRFAIISQSLASEALHRETSAPFCLDTPGFDGEPDLHEWEVLPAGQRYAVVDNVPLIEGTVYHVIVHAFVPGVESASIYSSTNGTLVEPEYDSDYYDSDYYDGYNYSDK
eukprot:TRINITY_DN1150_c0_g1_i1.p1 TRINITY_DN1150_c0_g1~~TRINITY_DN1150_c0_g1_i1.p1  ORF type:complete len:172 (+),score=51.29 TRINITY_DN1150_c0_g1_i1:1-516(+)